MSRERRSKASAPPHNNRTLEPANLISAGLAPPT